MSDDTQKMARVTVALFLIVIIIFAAGPNILHTSNDIAVVTESSGILATISVN